MPDTRELDDKLNVRDVKMGDLLLIIDAGEIIEGVDKKSNRAYKNLLIGVTLPNGCDKKAKINAYSRQNLSDAWGPQTEKWIGKTAMVSIQKGVSGDYIVLYPSGKAQTRDDGITEVVPF